MASVLASVLFACRTARSVGDASARQAFKQRCSHALLILGSVFYLQLMTVCIEGVDCQLVGTGQLLVQQDSSTVCYAGWHLFTAVVIYLLLGLYGVAFPCFITWKLWKMRELFSADADATHSETGQAFVFLTIDLQPAYYWFRATPFLISAALALQHSFVDSIALGIFMAVAVFSANIALVSIFMPFRKNYDNALAFCCGVANLANSAVFLLYLSSNPSPVFLAIFSVTIAFPEAALVYRWLPKCMLRRGADSDSIPMQDISRQLKQRLIPTRRAQLDDD